VRGLQARMFLARGWTLGLQLVPQRWVWAMGVGRWLVAGVVGSMEVADAVVVAEYRGALQGVSGPLWWLRELLHPLPAQWWWLDTGGRCRGCQDHCGGCGSGACESRLSGGHC
jgi:hypothetical protein